MLNALNSAPTCRREQEKSLVLTPIATCLRSATLKQRATEWTKKKCWKLLSVMFHIRVHNGRVYLVFGQPLASTEHHKKKALSQKSLTSSRFLRLTVNGFYMLRQYLYFRPLKFRFFTLPQQMDFDAAFVGCNLIKRWSRGNLYSQWCEKRHTSDRILQSSTGVAIKLA